jgi:pyruvate dehydrogenase E2 component (dihydrolipoamide acetyltransferase)
MAAVTDMAELPGRGAEDAERLSLVRRAMARQMALAAVVPCFYLRLGADVSELLAARAAARAAAGGAPVPSFNDLVVRAAALALRAHPEVNASYDEHGGAVVRYARVNVGVAIAIPGALVVPAVYDADAKDAARIGADVRDLAARAAGRKLGRDVLTDATFTVSNLGMYGVEDFDPVLNPPQAAILAVGAASAEGRLRLTLGCDHRVLTGAEGAVFLATLRDHLQSGAALLGGAAAVAS